MTNFELGTRVPLIISAPWLTASKGQRSMALAEAVDLYPTLSELAMGAGQLPTVMRASKTYVNTSHAWFLKYRVIVAGAGSERVHAAAVVGVLERRPLAGVIRQQLLEAFGGACATMAQRTTKRV